MTDGSQDPPGRKRSIGLLDDYSSIAIVATILALLVTIVLVAGYLVATGAVGSNLTVTGDVTISGTIPVGQLAVGLLMFVGWMVYIAFSDIYGRKRVNNATEQLEELNDGE